MYLSVSHFGVTVSGCGSAVPQASGGVSAAAGARASSWAAGGEGVMLARHPRLYLPAYLLDGLVFLLALAQAMGTRGLLSIITDHCQLIILDKYIVFLFMTCFFSCFCFVAVVFSLRHPSPFSFVLSETEMILS